MAEKYHISPTTGNPNRCYASTKPCPISGEDGHFDSKEEARKSFEESHDSVLAPKLKKASASSKTPEPTPDIEFLDATTKIDTSGPPLSGSEKIILQRIGEGKPVSNEKLDKLVDTLRWCDSKTPYNSEEEVEAGKKVLAKLKEVRSASPEPSTLTTADSFDPATQTLFSNKYARNAPPFMAKSLKRNLAHAEWLDTLANQGLERSQDPSLTSEEKEEEIRLAEQYFTDSDRTKAKVEAQLKEAQWCYDNDENFRKKANPAIAAQFRNKAHQRISPRHFGTPLDGVSKVKK